MAIKKVHKKVENGIFFFIAVSLSVIKYFKTQNYRSLAGVSMTHMGHFAIERVI
jgi:hypothetical protein